jgi:hypothetical protein
MTGPDKPCQRTGLIHYDVLNEMVLYYPGAAQAAAFNESATAIWALCDGTHTVDDICAELAQLTSLPTTQLRSDVLNALEQLRALDLLASDSA